jgi:acetyl esterase/lipase
MKVLLFALYVLSARGSLNAQKPVWKPSPGNTQGRYGRARRPIPSPSRARSTLKPRERIFFPVADFSHPATADKHLGLNPDLHIASQTPPTFLLQNEDDHVDNVNDSLAYYIALKNAGVPVEMHLYAQGGHAFGLRRTKLPVTAWPQLVETRLRTIGMISE